VRWGADLEGALFATRCHARTNQFGGASATSKRELRMVIMLQEEQRLEVEALNCDALDMWAIALQHVVLARSPADPTKVAPPTHFGGGGTHRNWGAPETARGPREAGPVVNRLLLPSPAANHGAMTTRLLNGVAAPAPARNAGFATSRAPRHAGGGWGTARNAVPTGPMTARGPGHKDVVPDIVSMNAHVLLSKARHNRKDEMICLLDDASKQLHVDVQDETGNSVLIIACQNNHKKIVKELLRRSCDINHQNHKGHTCLHYCFAYKYTELGEYLISKGADASVRNAFGLTCFEGLDVKRPATALAPPQAWASPDAQEPEGRRVSEADGAQVEAELKTLKRRMDQLEKENLMLKEGGLTARRGEVMHKDFKATPWPAPVATATAALPASLTPPLGSHALRSSGSGTDNDDTLGAEVAEVVQAIADGKSGGGERRDDTDTDGDGDMSGSGEEDATAKTGVAVGGRRAVQGKHDGAPRTMSIGGLGTRPPPSAPKPAVLHEAGEEEEEAREGENGANGPKAGLTTPDCLPQGDEIASVGKASLFPLRTPVVEEAASTVQLGGRFEKPASSVASWEGRSRPSSLAGGGGVVDVRNVSLDAKASAAQGSKQGKENLGAAAMQVCLSRPTPLFPAANDCLAARRACALQP